MITCPIFDFYSSSEASSTVVCKLLCPPRDATGDFDIPDASLAVVPAFFFFDFGTFCHPHNGTKLSKKPTSSNKLGNNHIPGGNANIVIIKSISLTTAITAIPATRHSNAIDKYHTAVRKMGGQRGNKIAPKTTMTIPI